MVSGTYGPAGPLSAVPRGGRGHDIDLLILSQFFYPELISTGQLLTELAEDFAADGFRVRVIAGQPSYYGAERVPSRIDHRGVDIRRVWSTQRNKNRPAGRLLNQATFLGAMAMELRTLRRASRVLAVTCPPYLPMLSALSARLFGTRVYTLVHDVYPDIAVALGYLRPSAVVTAGMERLTRWMLQNSERVVVLGRDMRDVVGRKLPETSAQRMTIIENWSDGTAIRPISKGKSRFAHDLDLLDRFVVQYSGNMGPAHEMEWLIRAAKELEREGVVFLFIGGGARLSELQEMVREFDVENVRLLPYQPKEMLTESLGCADVSVVSLAPGFEGLSVPSKVYGILASGRPVLAIMNEHSEVAMTVREGACGYVVKPGDVAGVVGVIRELMHDPRLAAGLGIAARRHFESRYERKQMYLRFRELMFGLPGGSDSQAKRPAGDE